MLTPEDIRAARLEANEWERVINYLEEIHNHSFAKRGVSFETALLVMVTNNFKIPMLAHEGDEDNGDSIEDGDTNS